MTAPVTSERPNHRIDGSFVIATWFGSGLMPIASGTWGSLAALPFAWGLMLLGGPLLLLAASVVLFGIGWWASAQIVRRLGREDPGLIVVDEVVGQWLTLTVAPLDPLSYLVGFLLFRAADIAKPFPAGWADRRVPGGLGVMLDDVLAAIWSAAAFATLRWVIPW